MIKRSYFGQYGGRFVPEILIPPLQELEKSYEFYKKDSDFLIELNSLLTNFAGRPTPLSFAKNLTSYLKGPKIYFKREDLLQTGAHKINNTLGQALLARKMGKKRLVAETGAGQHGVSVACSAAKLGFRCTVYMGQIDYDRQRPNVFWMERLGAQVIPVQDGTQVLKDAVNATIKDWITNIKTTHFLLGSALGPHPYPTIVRNFQSVIGKEAKKQILKVEGRLPDVLIACVGGGSNSIGLFYEFLKNKEVKLIGVEAGGLGKKRGQHACRFNSNDAHIGIVEGYKSFFLQDKNGNVLPTHSISAGLDYAGVGPEHAFLHDKKNIRYVSASDKEALSALKLTASLEGIIPALESAHAIAHGIKMAKTLSKDKIIVINLSGRGDKDIFIIAEALKDKKWEKFIRGKSKLYK